MSTNIKTSAILAAAATWVRDRANIDARIVSWGTASDALRAVTRELGGTEQGRQRARSAFCKTARVQDIAAYRPQSVADIVSAFVDAEVDQRAVEKAEEDKAAEELRKQHGIRTRGVWTERDIARTCSEADKGQPYRIRSERASAFVTLVDLTPAVATTLRAAEGISTQAVYYLHLPTVTLEFETDTWQGYRVTQRRPGNIIVDLFDGIEHARAWFLTLANYPVDEPVQPPAPKIEPVACVVLATLPAGSTLNGVHTVDPDGTHYATQWFPGVTLPNGGTLSITENPPAPEPVKAEEPEPASHPGLLLREILRKGSKLFGVAPDGRSVVLVYDPEVFTRGGCRVPASWDVNTLNSQGQKTDYVRFIVYSGDDGYFPKCDDVTAFRKAREHFLKLTAKPAGADFHDIF